MLPTPRLLVVDDSPAMREFVRSAATTSGYDVVGEARDGYDGVVAAIQLMPDVVVMDWRMPELDGLAATSALHERRPEIDVIAFSSADASEAAPSFLEAGAVAYVDKHHACGLIDELERRRETGSPSGPA